MESKSACHHEVNADYILGSKAPSGQVHATKLPQPPEQGGNIQTTFWGWPILIPEPSPRIICDISS